MKIEIFENEEKIDLSSLIITNYTDELYKIRENVIMYEFDLSSIKSLKGEKNLLEKSFEDIKNELV
jgi:hypothetical protein